MLTGKIYKNRLAPEQTNNHIQAKSFSETRQITKVKSQPGLRIGITSQRAENIENWMERFKVSEGLKYHFQNEEALKDRSLMKGCEEVMEYEKKMREHIFKVEERYEIRIAQLEAALEAKNTVISAMKDSLQEKEKVIDKLQTELGGSFASRMNTSRYN